MDFRLKAFISVAQNLNFTKAAKELNISQPAISKHIRELENFYGVQLFDRLGNRIRLTESGEIFLHRALEIVQNYQDLNLEMKLESGKFSGTFRVGASTTIAQYVLPKLLAKYINRFPEVRLTMMSGNSHQIEEALEEYKIDIGLIEGNIRLNTLRYAPFAKDELVLITSTQNKIKDEISIEELQKLPLVVREDGSGTLDVITKALERHNLTLADMNIILKLGSSEGIKSFLEESKSMYAIISIAAVADELYRNIFSVVEVEGLTMERNFAFAMRQGAQNELVNRFIQFVDNQKL